MPKADAIDLTVIGMGYFKAAEQLMYEIVCLRKNEGKTIKAKKSKEWVRLDDDNMSSDAIDFTLGAMAHFYSYYFGNKYSPAVFRDDISRESKKCIAEVLFSYAALRNGYFHKHNIHSPEKIDEVRRVTLCAIFLLLGRCSLNADSRSSLGIPDESIFDDYYRLCEYVNYHRDDLFIEETDGCGEFWGYGVPDYGAVVSEGGYVLYSQLRLAEFKTSKHIIFRKLFGLQSSYSPILQMCLLTLQGCIKYRGRPFCWP